MTKNASESGRTLSRAAAAVALGAVGALVAVAATSVVQAAAKSRPPGATKTQVGAPARDHVVLQLNGTMPPRFFRRVGKDGVVESTRFVVPKGAALHVTDVEYVSGWMSPGAGAPVRALRVEIVADDFSSRGTVGYVTPLSPSPPDLGTTIFDVGGSRMTSGFVVGAGAHLEVDAPGTLAPATGDPTPQLFHGDVIVRGYMVKDR